MVIFNYRTEPNCAEHVCYYARPSLNPIIVSPRSVISECQPEIPANTKPEQERTKKNINCCSSRVCFVFSSCNPQEITTKGIKYLKYISLMHVRLIFDSFFIFFILYFHIFTVPPNSAIQPFLHKMHSVISCKYIFSLIFEFLM